MWLAKYRRFLFLIVLMRSSDFGSCNGISNTQFNASVREYAVAEDSNSTDIRILQKELYEKYANLAPVSNKIRFIKEVPDSALSQSSTHGRGLLHLNHHGYGLTNYEESPYHGYTYEYHYPDDHHGHYDNHDHSDHHHDHVDHHHDHDHDFHHDHNIHLGHSEHHGHHLVHHDDHKNGYGHHYKHYDHALAAKTVLWPIAGIALLGAAAALVSNPVLLQLGVVSGRRRRRDTEEVTTDQQDTFTKKELQDAVLHNLKNFNKNNKTFNTFNTNLNKRMGSIKGMLLNKAMNNNHRLLFRHVNPTVKTAIQSVSNKPGNNGDSIDKHYIPIPLMIRDIDVN